jgi:hypothetical protein
VGFALGYLFIPFINDNELNTLLLVSFKYLNDISNIMTSQNIIGFFTSLGSLATFGTLVYLIMQNKEQKNHQSKQVKMWDEQNEQLSFQKYQTHRAEFFNLISSIEVRNNGVFVVKHKNKLYNRLFPRNSFVDTRFNYDNEILCTDNPFLVQETVLDEYQKETNILKLNDDECLSLEFKNIENAVYKLDLCTCKLLNLFELECIETPKIGFVHAGDFVVMDGLSPFRQIDRLINITNEFRQFANMPPYYGTKTGNSFYSPLIVAKKVIQYYMDENNCTSRSVYASGLTMLLLKIHETIGLIGDEKLKGLITSFIQPMDFLGHNSLLNNFNYDIKSVTIELRSRLKKLNVSCAVEVEKDTALKTLLAKIDTDLNAMP